MQSTALALSPLTPLLRPLNKNPNHRYGPLWHLSSLKPLGLLGSINGFSFQKASHLSSCSRFNARRISQSFLISDGRCHGFKVRATPVPENIGDTNGTSGLATSLQLGAMFAIWYLLNIYFNIFNKQVIHPFSSLFLFV